MRSKQMTKRSTGGRQPHLHCLHTLKQQQIYTNIGNSRSLPPQAKQKLTLQLMCAQNAAKQLLHSTLLLSLNLQGTHRCWRCDKRVQPPVLSCSTQAPTIPAGVPILSPQTCPQQLTYGLTERHTGDQRQYFKQSQTYPKLQSNHWAMKGKMRWGHVCHRAGSVPSRTSLETSLSSDMVFGCFRCSAWNALVFSRMLTTEESFKPGTTEQP